MPMIPQFQGGVPQVQDSGNAGISPARLPAQTFDYGKVMETAMKPVQDFANSFTKTIEVERARMIKAESDDAERQVIGALNDALMGENGYLNQQGKNAVDGYKAALEGVKSSVDGIMDGLSPQAREAIQSRVYDRVQSTVNQANQHRMVQNRQWQVGSSEGRLNALIEDIGVHGGDAQYVEKSMASLMQEADYLCNLRGYDEAQTLEYKRKVQDLATSKQLLVLADKDPVSAFVLFGSVKGSLSSEVAIRLDSQIFNQAKDLFALSLVSKANAADGAKPAWMKDPLAKTGDEFIDSLSPDHRLKITLKASQLTREGLAEKRTQISEMAKNSIAQAKSDPNAVLIPKDVYIEAYGEKAGEKNYQSYVAQFETNKAISGFVYNSKADNYEVAKASKPSVDSPNYAEELKLHESQMKAYEQVQKERESDAIQFGVDNQIAGFANIDFEQDSAVAIENQLAIRAQEMLPKFEEVADDKGIPRKTDVSMSAKWGVKPQLLSKKEASQLVSYLEKSPIDKRVQMMKNIYNAVGDRGVASLAMQMKNGNADYALAMSAMGYSDKSGMSLGEISLLGSDAIKTKMVKIDYTAETGDVAMIRKELMGKGDVEGVFDNPQVLDASVAFLTNIFAYQRSTGGGMSYKKAVERAFGEIAEYNGKKIVLPRGVNWMSSFRSLVRNKGAEIAKGKGEFIVPSYVRDISSQQMGDMLKDCKLQSYKMDPDGGYQYKVLYEGRLVYTQKRVKGKDGSEIVAPDAPLVITLKAN